MKDLEFALRKIGELKTRINSQLILPSTDMTEEEKLTADVWNPILRSWLKELEEIENGLQKEIASKYM